VLVFRVRKPARGGRGDSSLGPDSLSVTLSTKKCRGIVSRKPARNEG
jgi:hypothetical protein